MVTYRVSATRAQIDQVLQQFGVQPSHVRCKVNGWTGWVDISLSGRIVSHLQLKGCLEEFELYIRRYLAGFRVYYQFVKKKETIEST